MGNVQAQSLNYGLSILGKFFYYILICISGKEHSLLLKFLALGNRSTDIFFRETIL